MVRPKIKFTYEDYRNISDDQRCELIEGDLVIAPSPVAAHQRILGKLGFLLMESVRRNKLGEVFYAPYDIVFSEENVLQPDILYISNESAHVITPANIQGSPDLVIEITYPTTQHRDYGIKRKLYAKFGVREYWLVDPDKQAVEVMEPGKKGFNTVGTYTRGMKIHSPVLTGFPFDPGEIF